MAQAKRPFRLHPTGELHIYTDGACSGNGTAASAAGIGVWVESNELLSISEPVPDSYPHTNQVAELLAVSRALDIASRASSLCIYTDSNYVVNSVNTWYDAWRNNGWKKRDGSTPANIDIIREVREKMNSSRLHGCPVTVMWVKGHSSNIGNKRADELAQKGAKMASRLAVVKVQQLVSAAFPDESEHQQLAEHSYEANEALEAEILTLSGATSPVVEQMSAAMQNLGCGTAETVTDKSAASIEGEIARIEQMLEEAVGKAQEASDALKTMRLIISREQN